MHSHADTEGNVRILVVSLTALSPHDKSRLGTRFFRPGNREMPHGTVYHDLGGTPPQADEPVSMATSQLDPLTALLRSLASLRLVVTFGITAHLTTIESYGIPWSRIPYRAGLLTALPDGLIIANLPALGIMPLETMEPALTRMIPVLRREGIL
ncbi:hypothetical protein [Swaminathania salitolerans]|uniref:Uracil-DNA glycosylase-like domain-containing protein n=1 Tax=Swaminathania salitolerans TaxID=182838 RepID=A0A511BP41_9PROT|nr:hypothetical protein [Swaminathania salitolerans]GBQ15588.1 hypothetical protein AA21291_2225 [Swaminathania salitolerans LMG 21291]GEL01414.1 hypothetical protein SSA02_05770 [Swaminathania salitolerans]